jgi:anti-anti-sigma factor
VALLQVLTEASMTARTIMETTDFAHLISRSEWGAPTEFNSTRSNNIRRVSGLGESEVRFSLRGELDISNKWQLFAALTAYIDSPTLTIDLEHTTFIDASTLGVFVYVARCRREIDATRLRIVKGRAYFRRIFSLCSLDGVFDIEDAVAGSPMVTALP